MAKLAALQELQKCSAVPNFVHMFNVLHADYLAMPRLDIDEYEYFLLPDHAKDPDDVHDPVVVPNIVIKLLKGCGQAYVREDTCFDILRGLALRKWHVYASSEIPCPFLGTVETATAAAVEAVPGEPLQSSNQADEFTAREVEDKAEPADVTAEGSQESGGDLESTGVNINEIDVPAGVVEASKLEESVPPSPQILTFHALQPHQKAEIMLVLLNAWMMGHLVKTNFIDSVEPDRLRITPCGHDQSGAQYFYLFGIRLYKESNAQYEALTGTGTFDWELIASEPESFAAILAGLKKTALPRNGSRALITHLEGVLIPGLAAHFEEKQQIDLQRRMDHRRRRSIALQQAKERVKLERQEAAAALRSAKRLRSSAAADGGAPNHRNDGSWCGDGRRRQSTAASRAERYKRRSALFEMDDSTRQESPSEQPRALQPSQRQPRYEAGGSAVAPRHPETKEELMERAGRLLLELLSRQTVAWPVLRATG